MRTIELVLAIIGSWTVVSVLGGAIFVLRRHWLKSRVLLVASIDEPEHPPAEAEQRRSA